MHFGVMQLSMLASIFAIAVVRQAVRLEPYMLPSGQAALSSIATKSGTMQAAADMFEIIKDSVMISIGRMIL